MHPHPDSSKFPSRMPQCGQKLGASLPDDRSNGAGVRGQFQLSVPLLRNANAKGEGPRQVPTDDLRQRFLAIAAGGPGGKRRVGAKDAL